MKRKHQILSVVLLGIVLTFVIRALVPGKPEPIVIGYIGSLSGKYAHMGVSARDGAILAIEQINASGGIKNHPLELRIIDDEGLPENAAEGVETLAKEGVKFLIGPFLSASGVAVLPEVNKIGILTVSPTTSSENLMGKDDYYLNISPASQQFGQNLSELVGKLQVKKVVIISDRQNNAFCLPFIDGFLEGQADRPATVKVLGLDDYREGILLQTARRAAAFKPESVVLCTSGIEGAILTQHLKMYHPEISIFSSAWAMSIELLRNGGSAVEGMKFFSAVNLMDNSQRFTDFTDSFKDRFHREATMVSILNYDAAMILLNALGKSPGISPEAVKSVIIESGEFDGLQQKISFDKNGDAQRKLIPHIVEGGLFVPQNQ